MSNNSEAGVVTKVKPTREERQALRKAEEEACDVWYRELDERYTKRQSKYHVSFHVEPFRDYKDSVGTAWLELVPRLGDTLHIEKEWYTVTQVNHIVMLINRKQRFEGGQFIRIHLRSGTGSYGIFK